MLRVSPNQLVQQRTSEHLPSAYVSGTVPSTSHVSFI